MIATHHIFPASVVFENAVTQTQNFRLLLAFRNVPYVVEQRITSSPFCIQTVFVPTADTDQRKIFAIA
ncbi:MAG: Uncharacterised protein [Cryomorphaceae bacterium]|nr:MAG: Uncharacterised protein [Cryomorphaceae bacterium]